MEHSPSLAGDVMELTWRVCPGAGVSLMSMEKNARLPPATEAISSRATGVLEVEGMGMGMGMEKGTDAGAGSAVGRFEGLAVGESVSLSHQIRSWLAGKLVSDMFSTVPSIPKKPLLFLEKQPFVE
eukprot:CAMPEP_0172300990 /NCGR_PEP_ID=MMETSP1058-20130122/2985_1 /TAXON_ID=83371 /ORGANISM="Detonula confervacea, Strain CCMP 353" /LENGTH=125 /DNA_ID=CAMNT_0013010971 /DNA_START=365 /DNA_END=742 /DNA_ORIENTATION=+